MFIELIYDSSMLNSKVLIISGVEKRKTQNLNEFFSVVILLRFKKINFTLLIPFEPKK